MVRALSDGDDRHRLENGDGQDIGWIVPRAIGFRGFPTKQDAMTAAIDSWRALEAALNREYAGRPRREVASDRVRIVHDGSSEWVADGKLHVARLQRSRDDATGDSSFSIELELPSYASVGVTIAAAQVIARVLEARLDEAAGVSASRSERASAGVLASGSVSPSVSTSPHAEAAS